MARWVVLLRGVNVGGHNVVEMTELRAALSDTGFESVKTYIQSGNIVLTSARSRDEIAGAVKACLRNRFGANVPVFVLCAQQLATLVEALPFEGDPSRVLLYFCMTPLESCEDAVMREHLRPDEELLVTRDVIFLHAPAGVSTSKLAARIERHVPVSLTARNLRTVRRLVDMVSVA